MAIFTLEALPAAQGDCLLLHYGTTRESSKVILIDGGPGTATYLDFLEPRLRRLAKHFTPSAESDVPPKPLGLPLVICSHVDADQIRGVIELVKAIVKNPDGAPAKIACLWHNRPFDLLGEQNAMNLLDAVETSAHRGGEDLRSDPMEDEDFRALRMIIQSYPDGDELQRLVHAAGITPNCGFDDLVMVKTPDETSAEYQIDDLTLTVIGPDQDRIQKLKDEWARKDPPQHAQIAVSVDTTATNLSSIVFVATFGGRTILMPRDARGDYIYEGLLRAKLTNTCGCVKFDIIKLQHHGSIRNVTADFFRRVHADHYVISANGSGKDDNPDFATFEALVKARGETGYCVWMTYGAGGTKLAQRVAAIQAEWPRMDLVVRANDEPSLLINLEEQLDY